MIEFYGCISGAAEKHRTKKDIVLGLIIGYITLTVMLPVIIFIAYGLKVSVDVEMWYVLIPYFSFYALIPLTMIIPTGKKMREENNTIRVFTDEEYIVASVAKQKEEYKLIEDVKVVNDYGEFYQLIFPWEKGISNIFICQKNLIIKGTIEEFEALFEGKIVRIPQ